MSKFRKTIRSGKTKIKIDLPSLETLSDKKKLVTTAVKKELERKIRDKSLELVSVGKSPVKGVGRFKAYATQRNDDPRGYPNDSNTRSKFPGKKTRPVNLKLSNDMPYLKAIFKAKFTDGGIEIGKPSDKLLAKLFEAHNEGEHDDVPQRKVIPTGGDTFTESIILAIKNIYLKRIKNVLS